MEVPVDEKLIKMLYSKYTGSTPDQATIDQINEKYGEDNRSFARDFYLENVEEAEDDNWLEGKLSKVDKHFPSTPTTEPEEEVKKKKKLRFRMVNPKKPLLHRIQSHRQKRRLFRIFQIQKKRRKRLLNLIK